MTAAPTEVAEERSPAEPARRRLPVAAELLLAALGSVVAAVAMTWPVLRHPRSTVPGDVGDPLLQAWQVAWAGTR